MRTKKTELEEIEELYFSYMNWAESMVQENEIARSRKSNKFLIDEWWNLQDWIKTARGLASHSIFSPYPQYHTNTLDASLLKKHLLSL